MSPPTEFPCVLSELVRTNQAFLNYAAIHAYTLELTLPQLDIILTLGHAFGMTFKRLGEKTLITKGTLTGIINRMEHKGLVQRIASKTDGRSQIVRLTTAGQTLFEQAVPEHLDYVNQQAFQTFENQLDLPTGSIQFDDGRSRHNLFGYGCEDHNPTGQI